ncbi:BTAD domain-containing putative transcriptional regulator [Streptomyces sp. WMMC500]|uniref:BTAD domain-containing putative transcriptional regulator n=1 Tax=Streptomyces sp. WMMC500 TaxID=3015154 RepID=UPI00248BDE7C|nr:BTAD domain-containing putative transcriptional regulator [Streptomyces sp. WMMC500]WBB62749.1 BTAD domain-containing putative transcriptional regulator [Streptomyces sp. WMMC500]
MRFGVLGPLAVWTAGGQAVRVPEVKVRSLLADLLIHAGRAVPADRLVDDLWGDAPPANPAGALQTRVSQLRRALEDAEPGARALVVSRPPGYLLDVDPEATDTGRFTALTAAARRADGPRARAALLADALALWRGEVLADFADEEFARAEIARLDELRLTALEEQAEARLDLGEHALLADELGDLVGRHPLRERLRAAQLRALYRAGRQSEALASYGTLRVQLAEELGLDPGPELVALHQSILEQDPALGAPEREQTAVRGNLPAPHGELIGRDESVTAVRALLATARLVTLTGPGGVGKTRLALETARGLPGSFPDGVWLVELSALAPPRPTAAAPPGDTAAAPDADEAAEVVAAALGVRDETAGGGVLTGAGGAAPAERLADALRTKRTLLVLDNCEHVVDAVAALCARLLAAAPGVHVLATGQEPLGVGGEHLWPVAPLDLPPPEVATRPTAPPTAPRTAAPTPDPTTTAAAHGTADRAASPAGADGAAHPAADPGLAALRASGAVRLFAERAAAVAPGFAVDAANAAAVATVCRRLDGIPLALELAATRVRALGVHELAARLDDRFRLLSAGPRDAPARQRTLRAMLDWSWELLTGPEQAVLRRLSLHADGCTVHAAEAVCAGDGIAEDDVLDLLARLVDRSLVMTAPGDGVTPARYHLLESVAAYGHERLCEAGEFTSVRRRHTAYYAALAAEAEPQLRGPAQRQWLLRLDAESANMRAALEDAVATGAAATALGLAGDLAWYWVLRGRLGEGRRFLTTALATPPAPPEPRTPGTDPAPEPAAAPAEPAAARPDTSADALTAARTAALTWRAAMTLRLGETLAPDALPAVRPPPPTTLPELAAGARADAFLGLTRLGLGPLPGGDDPLTRAEEVFRALGDQWGTAAVSSTLARQAVLRGDLPALAEYGERSMALFAGLGDRWGQLHATYALGTHAEITGDYAQAARLHREGLRMAEDLGLWSEVSDKLSMLGRVALLTGEVAQADELHGRAARLAAEQGYVVGEEFAGLGLAMGARRQGRLAEAEAHLRRWLEWDRKIESDVGTALILAELGFVAELAGDPERARAHHREGLAFARPTGDPRAVALALEGLAGAESLAGNATGAARLLGRAAALRASAGAPLPEAERTDADRITARLRAELGPEGLAAELAKGEAADEQDLTGDA